MKPRKKKNDCLTCGYRVLNNICGDCDICIGYSNYKGKEEIKCEHSFKYQSFLPESNCKIEVCKKCHIIKLIKLEIKKERLLNLDDYV